jgi:uncharacterized protein YndB with AHSA1/START domain
MNVAKPTITVGAIIKAPIEKVWKYFNEPAHIMKWNSASADWHTTSSQNDLKVGGKFLSRMEAKDGSFGFDFGGIYEKVTENELMEYILGDGRRVIVTFEKKGDGTKLTETFEAEGTHSLDQQKEGWQAILNNFKKYVEAA